MKRKKWMMGILMALLLCSIVACGGKKEEEAMPAQPKQEVAEQAQEGVPSDGDAIYIGVSCAITGDTPLEGEMMLKTIQMAVEECNETGGINGSKVEIVYEDDGNTANTAVNVMEKMVADERIVLMIGPHRSASVLAVEAIAKGAGMSVITGGSSKNFYACGNEYLFRIRGCDTLVAANAAKFACENFEASKVGIIYDTDDYGNGAYEIMKEYITANYPNIEIVAEEGITTDTTDCTGQLLNVKNGGAQVLLCWVHDNAAAIIIRQFKELGMDADCEVVGSSSFANTAYYALLEDGVSDGVYVIQDFTVTNPEETCAKFTEKFEELYGQEPETMAGCYYDAAKVALDGLRRAAENGSVTRESVHEALAAPADPVIGNQGKLYLSENGMDFIHQVIVAQSMNNVTKYMYVVEE